MKVKFFESRFSQEEKEKIRQDFEKLLKNARLTEGPFLERLEAEISKISGWPALVLNSATAALYCVLRSLPERRVVTSCVNWKSVYSAIQLAGKELILVDVNSNGLGNFEGFSEDEDTIFLSCPLWGQRDGNITKIVDASHRHYLLEEKKNFSSIYVFSLHSTKILTAGEGGIVLCLDPQISSKVFGLRREHFGNEKPTLKFLMPEASAIIAYHTISARKERLESVRKAISIYREELRTVRVRVLSENDWSFMVVRFSSSFERNNVLERLKEREIEAMVKYPSFASGFPVAEKLTSEIFCLPLYPYMEEGEILTVCNALKEALR